MAHFTLFLQFIVFSLQLCIEKGFEDDQTNNDNLFWILAKNLAVVSHIPEPVADVVISAFQSGL